MEGFWKERNVFVTGATGLLGSWLVEEPLGRQARVTCLLRDWVPGSKFAEEGFLARTNVVRGELEDCQVLLRALNEYEIDTVFHLGAQTIVGYRLPFPPFHLRGQYSRNLECLGGLPGLPENSRAGLGRLQRQSLWLPHGTSL